MKTATGYVVIDNGQLVLGTGALPIQKGALHFQDGIITYAGPAVGAPSVPTDARRLDGAWAAL